jgi:predicted amidohydrolase
MIPKEYIKYEQTVSVACVSFSASWGDKSANLERIKTFVVEASKQGNNLIIFPECALTGFECADDVKQTMGPCQMHREAAETIPGPSTEELAKLARELGVYIIFGMPERDKMNPKIHYNSTAVIGPEGIIGASRKLHLGLPPWVNEGICFTQGDELKVFETTYGPIGVLLCYDFLLQPELPRLLMLKGALLIAVPSASGTGPGKMESYIHRIIARAAENLIYCAVSNAVGTDRHKSYFGHSCIAGPGSVTPGALPQYAQLYASGTWQNEEIVSATLNFEKLHRIREICHLKEGRRADLLLDEFKKLMESEKA